MLRAQNWIILILGILTIPLKIAQADRVTSPKREVEKKLLEQLLDPTTYDSHIIPPVIGSNTDGVNVKVQVLLRDITEVDDHNNELTVRITFRQKWNDPRLNYTANNQFRFLTVHDLTKVWRPDLFISNAKEETLHGYDKPNTYCRISPNGDVLISERVSLTISCNMDLANHPFDTQSCVVRIASYGYNTDDVIVAWEENPFQVKGQISLPHFALTDTSTGTCEATTVTGTYACVSFTLELKRYAGYYFRQVFIPCTMFVIIGYLVFWLEPQNLMARLAVSLSTLYIASVQVSQLNSDLPKGPYKVLDNFTGACITFIFMTVIETVVVYNLTKREKLTARLQSNGGRNPDPDTEILELNEERNGFQLRNSAFARRNVRDYLAAIPNMSEKIDILFIAGYPIAYVVFTLFYFFVAAV